MTIEGTAFRNHYPCAGCSAKGEQIWLEAESNLCYECRHGDQMRNLRATAGAYSRPEEIHGDPESTSMRTTESEHTQLNTSLVVHEGEFEQQIQDHTLAIEEYVSADALAYKIEDAVGFTEAGSIINDIKRHLKELDAVEKTATRPMLAALDTVRGWFKPAKAQALKAREIWDGHIRTYLAAQAAEQQEVQRQLQAAAKAGNKVEMRAQLTKLEQAPVAQGVSIRQVWDWEVADKDLVPEYYWSINTDLIAAEMRKQVAAGMEPVIPGVTFTQKQVVAATGK